MNRNLQRSEAAKAAGLSLVLAPVLLLLASAAFTMAKYNYDRLPNPIALAMMLIAGGFALLFAAGAPAFLIGSMVAVVRALRQPPAAPRERKAAL